MASAGVGPAQQGRKRSLDAEINLVPFIDLLSMCICFLLMTAIWIEIGSIQVKQMLGTEAQGVTSEAIDLEVRLNKQQVLELVVEKGGRPIQSYTMQGASFAEKLTSLGNHAMTIVSSLSNQAVAQDSNSQTQQAVNITGRVVPSSEYNYGDLVSVLDVLRGSGVAQLAVIPVKE